jgi:hypothetical protein
MSIPACACTGRIYRDGLDSSESTMEGFRVMSLLDSKLKFDCATHPEFWLEIDVTQIPDQVSREALLQNIADKVPFEATGMMGTGVNKGVRTPMNKLAEGTYDVDSHLLTVTSQMCPTFRVEIKFRSHSPTAIDDTM